MKREIAEALEASIAHWDKNANAQTPKDASVGSDDCALCVMFPVDISLEFDGCDECPICLRTGLSDCRGSPYQYAATAYSDWTEVKSDEAAAYFRQKATAERDFLISLREPTDDQPGEGD